MSSELYHKELLSCPVGERTAGLGAEFVRNWEGKRQNLGLRWLINWGPVSKLMESMVGLRGGVLVVVIIHPVIKQSALALALTVYFSWSLSSVLTGESLISTSQEDSLLPQTALSFSSLLTPSSYFSCYTWEISPPLFQNAVLARRGLCGGSGLFSGSE